MDRSSSMGWSSGFSDLGDHEPHGAQAPSAAPQVPIALPIPECNNGRARNSQHNQWRKHETLPAVLDRLSRLVRRLPHPRPSPQRNPRPQAGHGHPPQLPHRAQARPGRHGSRLSRPAHPHGRAPRPEIPLRRAEPGPGLYRPFPARGPHPPPDSPSQRRRLRRPRIRRRRLPLLLHGVRRRPRPPRLSPRRSQIFRIRERGRYGGRRGFQPPHIPANNRTGFSPGGNRREGYGFQPVHGGQ